MHVETGRFLKKKDLVYCYSYVTLFDRRPITSSASEEIIQGQAGQGAEMLGSVRECLMLFVYLTNR